MGRLLAAILGFALFLPHHSYAQSPGDFDYYVLSLSWTPTFCQLTGNGRGEAQCASERPRAFVLHGLWPQYTRGFPEFCQGRHPPRIPESTISRTLDLMPSRGLIIHEWQRHGTCSGLDPQSYFDLARRAFNQIVIPEAYRVPGRIAETSPADVTAAFVAANPGLSRDGMSVSCRGNLLEEVRICLSRTLQKRRCDGGPSNSCRARNLTVPGG